MVLDTSFPGVQEAIMNGTMTYKVTVPELLARLKLRPIDLVRMTEIAVDTAYKAAKPEKAGEITLDTAFKIYNGLVDHGYDIEWSDVVTFQSQ